MSALQLIDQLISELEAATLDTTTKGDGHEKESKGKKEKKGKTEAAAPPAPPSAPTELNINALDLRVGVIVKVQKHETADKLYCEEIDCGDAEGPRPIASGLVPHYTLEEMMGRRLIVIANLSPRKLVGFKSHGMVLCAAKVIDADGKEKVEFVDPPAGAKPGDRIVGLGLTAQEPLSVKQCDKQKAFETLAPGMRVDANGELEWNGVKLVCNGEVCKAPTLRDCIAR